MTLPTVWTWFTLIAFEALNIWSIINGSITITLLRPFRKRVGTARATSTVAMALCLNAISWSYILLTAAVWPSTSDSSAPVPVQVSSALAFFGASIGLALAMHFQRRWISLELNAPPTAPE